ncbi:unnamed protein product [Heterotrigona itama]|uniref:Uncharacterized protein n=1 Tax=Heterotrigona itama TaxID=395501 RepID=A0A6V7HHS6_9HYME|nr:unnamed protein product [Heterotrigona itama]
MFLSSTAQLLEITSSKQNAAVLCHGSSFRRGRRGFHRLGTSSGDSQAIAHFSSTVLPLKETRMCVYLLCFTIAEQVL